MRELDLQGIFTYCINLDATVDAYVSDIFGRRYTVIDNHCTTAGAVVQAVYGTDAVRMQ